MTHHAIDFSPAYVEHAKRHNHDPRIVFQVGDACALDFPDHSFDRVLSLLVLHFVPGADRAIAEMRRVARPGAVVGATVWDARGGFVANRIFFDTAAALDPDASERRARNYTRPMTRPGELNLETAVAAARWRQRAVGKQLSADHRLTHVELLRNCGNRSETSSSACFQLARPTFNCRI